MEVEFFRTLEKARNMVAESTENILDYVEDENLKAKYLKQMEDTLLGYISCEHKVALIRQAVREASARACDEQPNASLFDDLLEESISELEQDSPLEQAVAQAPSLKKFKQQLEAHKAVQCEEMVECEELVATQSSFTFIDPISKKRMTDPVRNTQCGHVYDRVSVTKMISAKSRNGFRCPAVGCANRKAIKLSDLEAAPDVKQQLAVL